MPRLLSLVALTATACGSSSATSGITFDRCAPPTLFVPEATDDQLASVDEAIGMWRAHGVGELTRERAARLPQDLSQVEIVFRTAGPAVYGAYDDVTGTIYVNTRVTETAARAITIAHELGHAFALVHVIPDQRESVMNPGNLTITPNDGDRFALEQVWGNCPELGQTASGAPDNSASGP